MSTLADIELALVESLTDLTIDDTPVFKTVRAVTGDLHPNLQPALRDVLLREPTPAAYVAFLRETTDPRTALDLRGPHFAIWIAARAPNPQADPRNGSEDALGAFHLIAHTRAALDGSEPISDHAALPLDTTIAFADNRLAIYTLRYRILPTPEEPVAPGPPTGLTSANEDPAGSFLLQWEPPTVTATEGPTDYYRIYRKLLSDSDFGLLDTAANDAKSHALTGQPVGESLQFRLTAANSAGEGPLSNTIIVIL